ncbi:MAG: hypothetical protein OSA99_15935, partial [Acidimicrobiales bacterium]|nr:hypothetical protein [Acidimicrobiales bacterium]
MGAVLGHMGDRRAWVLAVLAVLFATTGVMRAEASSHDPGAAELSQQVGRALERMADLGSYGPFTDAIPASDALAGEASGIGSVFDDDAPDAFGTAEAGADCHDGVDGDGDGIADDGCGDDPAVLSLSDRFIDPAGNGTIDTFDGIMDALELSGVAVGPLTATIAEAADLTGVSGAVVNGDGIDYVQDPVTGDIDFAIELSIGGTFDAPIGLPTELVDLVAVGGDGFFEVPIELTSSPLHFHYDHALAFDETADAPAPTANEAVWLLTAPDPAIAGVSEPPAFDLAIGDGVERAVSSIVGELDLGFAGVDLDPTSFVNLQLMYGLALVDPDSLGGGTSDAKILVDELVNTDLAELIVSSEIAPASGQAVDAAFKLTSDLIPQSDPVDLTVDFDAPTIADIGSTVPTFAFPNAPGDFDLDFFRKLQSFTPTEALGGIDRLVGMLTAVQGGGLLDIDLPYLDGGTCDNGVDDDGDGVVDDGCLGSPEAANGVPETGALGGFSDALELGRKLADTINTALVAPPDPDSLGTIVPTFSNAQELAAILSTELGVPVDLTLDAADPVAPRLVFGLELTDSAIAPIKIQFGDLDIVNDIVITAGGAAELTAAYTIPLDFALDLTPEPTEDGAGIGSCADGVDNGDGDGADGLDGSDDCAASRTLEERVQVEVGTQADGRNEIDATLSLTGAGVGAVARVGILEVGISGGSMELGADGLGGGPAALSLDISTEADDGWMTIQEFLASLGNPEDEAWESSWSGDGWHRHVALDAGFSATLPVSADLDGVPIAGGDIVVTAGESGPLEDVHAGIDTEDPANAFSTAALVDSATVDASDLGASEIFNFSGCGNGDDDDGDGVADDGCEGGPAAVEAPESESTALFDNILAAIELVAAQLEESVPGDFSADIPLIGKSFEDLVDFASALEDFADAAALGAESFLPGACDPGNTRDDDGDGFVNDGCAQVGSFSEGAAQCASGNATNDDKPGDDSEVNDGCP